MEDKLPQMPQECIDAFNSISEIGKVKGYAFNSWEDESITKHVGKVIGHLGKWLVVQEEQEFEEAIGEEDHLLHAMWRLCAAVALVERNRKRYSSLPN